MRRWRQHCVNTVLFKTMPVFSASNACQYYSNLCFIVMLNGLCLTLVYIRHIYVIIFCGFDVAPHIDVFKAAISSGSDVPGLSPIRGTLSRTYSTHDVTLTGPHATAMTRYYLGGQ